MKTERAEQQGEGRTYRRKQFLASMTLAEIRNKIKEEIENTTWDGKNGTHVFNVLSMRIQDFMDLYKKVGGYSKIFEYCGATRGGAVVIPDGYRGMIMYDAVQLRLEEMQRITYAQAAGDSARDVVESR